MAAPAAAQLPYWQQELDYRLDVKLDDRLHSLDGFLRLRYKNNSPDTLRFIWFHVWPNAYKHDQTAFSDQLLENGDTRFYFSKKEDRGYINRLDFRVNDTTATLEDHPEHIDIVKLVLPRPLLPGEQTLITTPFHVKLPYNYSRGGHEGESYQVTQWYPKPAVYDAQGWHPMPYLDQGEFYSEFGRFDVTITLPSNYAVAATGVLQDSSEAAWLRTRHDFKWEPVRQKISAPNAPVKTTVQLYPPSAATTKTIRFVQDRVHDFAWFADKRFVVRQDTCLLPGGRIIRVQAFFTPGSRGLWEKAPGYAKAAIRHYSQEVGDYPYETVAVVEGPASFGGGMEYPTITVISPVNNEEELESVIVHEVGHNWFYGILASNERAHPWLDEGVNSFYEQKYLRTKRRSADNLMRSLLAARIAEKKDQPVSTSSPAFESLNYGLIAYEKAAQWMKQVEASLGIPLFRDAMQTYFRRWQFRHPRPADLKAVLEEVSGRRLDSLFSLLEQKGPLPGPRPKGTAVANPRDLFSGAYERKRNLITLLPALGFNDYDKLMAGALITNLRMPANRFQFLAIPLYGFGSKKLNGIGFANYSFYPEGLFRKVDIGISAASFSSDRFRDMNNNTEFLLGFRKWVPGFRLTLRESSPRSTRLRYIQVKHFRFQEDALRFSRDTLISGTDTTIRNRYGTTARSRSLNQLLLVAENNRALYPWRGEMRIEQGEDFIRTAFTGNYFFNYGVKGGLRVRLFAGKFFYTAAKTLSRQFANDRYHLNLTGANGYEDYTYSDYFIGRNAFQGFSSQQLMVRDGGFKMRTDLLADKVGKTDNWLAAVNLTTTVPDAVNPLALLPVKIPLRVFLDIGTYAGAWDRSGENERFLYDAGLQLSFLKETVNLYIPLLYSSVFRDYLQSVYPKNERFWKRIAFSIDLSNFSFRKLDRNLDF